MIVSVKRAFTRRRMDHVAVEACVRACTTRGDDDLVGTSTRAPRRSCRPARNNGSTADTICYRLPGCAVAVESI